MQHSLVPYELQDFAQIRDIRGAYGILARMARPEGWAWEDTGTTSSMPEVAVLSRYLRRVYTELAQEYDYFYRVGDVEGQNRCIHIDAEHACFHTGLHFRAGHPLYMLFGRSRYAETASRPWYFYRFLDARDAVIQQMETRPEYLTFDRLNYAKSFHPDWVILLDKRICRENQKVIRDLPPPLQDSAAFVEALCEALRDGREQSARYVTYAAPVYRRGRVEYALPLYLTGRDSPDAAAVLTPREGKKYTLSCLAAPENAYIHARLLGPVTADWMTGLVRDGVREQAVIA